MYIYKKFNRFISSLLFNFRNKKIKMVLPKHTEDLLEQLYKCKSYNLMQ